MFFWSSDDNMLFVIRVQVLAHDLTCVFVSALAILCFIIIDILDTFLINSVETNLAPTEAIIDLAICGYISVEGWFLRNPRTYNFKEEMEESDQQESEDAMTDDAKKLRAVTKCRRRPEWKPSSLPRFLQALDGLTQQVASYRTSIPRFEDLVQQRREAFQTADVTRTNLAQQQARASSNTATPGPERTSLEEPRAASPPRPGGFEGFAQRLFSEFGTPSRSASPRGRKETSRGQYTPSSGLASTLGFGSPSAKPIPPPKEFPLNLENPSLSGLGRSLSPGSHQGKDGSAFGGRESPVASQLAAFAAVDQSILARRVGLPGSETDKIDPIPLDFNKRPINGDTKGAEEAQEGEEEARDDAEETADPALDGEDEGDNDQAEPAHPDAKTASVSHIITNVIILQSFLLELAALVQVRASVFDEVRFA